MVSATFSPIYVKRESAAQAGTVLLGFAILFLSQTLAVRHEEPSPEAPISLAIISSREAPAKIAEPPVPVVQSPKLQKIVEPPSQVADAPDVKPPQPAPPPPETAPTHAEPQPPRSNSAAEGLFAQDVRVSIERKKIYPETARNLGMSGSVEVMYVLDRSGKLLRMEIVSSSGYKLLDRAALAAVQAAAYKAFPADAWVGESSKEFRTRLVFSIND